MWPEMVKRKDKWIAMGIVMQIPKWTIPKTEMT